MSEIHECECGSLHPKGGAPVDDVLEEMFRERDEIREMLAQATRIEFAGITNQRILVSLVEGKWSIQEATDGYGIKLVASFDSPVEAFRKLKEMENV